MSINISTFLIILGCTIVTLIPRVLPFIFVRNVSLPEPVLKWLSFIPVCILTALVVENLYTVKNYHLTINWKVLIVLVPTILIAVRTKSLSLTVIGGVFLMALVRLLL
ncbi:AzlD domain-containing protein [Priestia megaterium]